MRHSVVLITGDGIGPEVTEAVTRILSAAGADIDWVQRQAGLAALGSWEGSASPRGRTSAATAQTLKQSTVQPPISQARISLIRWPS